MLKRRVVRVNFGEVAQKTRVGAKLQVNLFEDLSVEGTVQQVEDRATKNYTLSGTLAGDENSTFVLSVLQDVAAMNVRMGNGKFYQVRFVQDGLHEIYEVNQDIIPKCGAGPEHAIAAPAAADAAPFAQGDTGETIDVMVVYTPAARTAAGSSNAIHAAINLAVSESNNAYQQSQINTRIRLVYAGVVTYTEAGFNNDLTRITNPGDGFMDEVHTLRNTYGADLVSLWINDTSSCGLAWLMTSLSSGFAANGFSVVHWGPGCATGYFSFAHEFAHNMGCTHDRAAAGGQGLYPYSYGWHFTGTNGVLYRSIMGYAPGTRIPRFSNPDVNYMGVPTGVPIGQANEAHNAQTINLSAFTVANFRQSVVSTNTAPSIIEQPQSQSVAIGETATFSVTATGTQPLSYFWRRAGTNIPGATQSSYSIFNVQTTDTNIYSVIVSNAFGTAVSSNATLSISTEISLGAALDNTGFTWITGGTAPWSGIDGITHDGIDAAASGDIDDDGYSILQTTIVGPGTLSFWWKVSSELGFDWLDVFLDGSLLDPQGISGNVDWSSRTFEIPAGSHTLAFQYYKDDIFSSGLDKGWVDQIFYIADSSFTASSLAVTNGQFRFVFNGRAGASYSLQASTNFIDWETVTNILSSSTNTIYIDPSTGSHSMRFYRVTSP